MSMRGLLEGKGLHSSQYRLRHLLPVCLFRFLSLMSFSFTDIIKDRPSKKLNGLFQPPEPCRGPLQHTTQSQLCLDRKLRALPGHCKGARGRQPTQILLSTHIRCRPVGSGFLRGWIRTHAPLGSRHRPSGPGYESTQETHRW